MLRYLAVLLLVTSPAWADDPAPVEPPKPIPAVVPQIVFPLLPTPDKVPVSPAPPADPDAVPTLAYGRVYIVQSDQDFILLASPQKLVTITRSPGPITVRGLFADGSGKIETRTFQSKFVAFVDVIENAAGRLELLAIPVGVADESAITRQLIDIGAGPRPPPPGPDPIPIVPPVPTPTGFRVIFVTESSANMTREQLNTLASTQIRSFLDQTCVKGADGRPDWRQWDKDVVVSAKESPTVAALWNTAKPQLGALPLPVMIVAVNGQATVMALGATEAETLAKLKTAAGVK